MYSVKEIYFTLQGEGAQAGRPAVFCRFAGCNLWSGGAADRARAVCRFCDTDYVGTDGPGGGRCGGAAGRAAACLAGWGGPARGRLVVITGGEPMLQVDGALIDALHDADFEVAIETNGTLAVPRAVDWICVSPKAGAPLVQTSGEELKLVFPQQGMEPAQMERLSFRHFFLQPMDSADRAGNTEAALAYCLDHPRWALSFQTHKLIGIR